MSVQKRLSDVIDVLKRIYHSVEIRAAFVQEGQKNGMRQGGQINRWHNLLTIIRFNPCFVSKLSYEIPIDGPKVKFVTWHYPFEMIWDRLVNGFANQTIILDQISHRSDVPFSIYLSTKWDLMGQDFFSFPIHRENYNEEWPVIIKTFKTSSSDQAFNIFRNDFEVSRYIESMNYENPEIALKEFLQMNIPPYQTDELHLVLKIPYKINEITINRKSSDIVDLKVGIVSENLDVGDLTCHIRQKINSKVHRIKYPLNASSTDSEKQGVQDKPLMWEIVDQLKNDPNSQIDVDLFHKDLGIIENHVKNFKELLNPDDTLLGDIPAIEPFTEKHTNNGETVERPPSLEELLHPIVYKHAYQQYRNGHLRDAVLNSFMAVFDMIRERTGLEIDGQELVTEAFSLERAKLIFSEIKTGSGKNDQKGFLQILIGAYIGIRNPKAHSLHHDLDKTKAAQYLVFASLLARRVSEAKEP